MPHVHSLQVLVPPEGCLIAWQGCLKRCFNRSLSPSFHQNGEAMTLDCQCRGDLALRHRECAIKWAQVKGDCICELCKHEVKNLPALPPRPPQEEGNAGMEDVYCEYGIS